MKIAICFYGLLRDVQNTYPGIKQYLIDYNNIEDIFIHTWYPKDGENIGNKNLHYRYISKKTDLDFVIDSYKPKEIIVEKNEILLDQKNYRTYLPRHKCITGTFNPQSMFYSLKKCSELRNMYEKTNNTKYDFIIVARFDLEILKAINVSKLRTDIISNTDFYTNKFNGWMGDVFSIGPPELIDKRMNIWNFFNIYYDSGSEMHPERMLHEHSEKQNFNYEPVFSYAKDHVLFNRK